MISYFDKEGNPKWFSNDGGQWFFNVVGGQPAAYTQQQGEQLWFFSPEGETIGWKDPGQKWIFEIETGEPMLVCG